MQSARSTRSLCPSKVNGSPQHSAVAWAFPLVFFNWSSLFLIFFSKRGRVSSKSVSKTFALKYVYSDYKLGSRLFDWFNF